MRNHAQQYALNDRSSSSNIKPLRHLDSLLILYSESLWVVRCVWLLCVIYKSSLQLQQMCANRSRWMMSRKCFCTIEWALSFLNSSITKKKKEANEKEGEREKKTFIDDGSERRSFEVINDRLNKNLIRNFLIHAALVSEHDSMSWFNSVAQFRHEGVSSAWHYYSYKTGDNNLT